MKFLISTEVQSFRSVFGDNYPHVCFCEDKSGLDSHISGFDTINVWICEGDEVTQELMDMWLDRDTRSPKTLLLRDDKLIPHLESLSRGRAVEIEAAPKQDQHFSSWLVATLRAGEMLHARAVTQCAVSHRKTSSTRDNAQQTVLVVGAGIMNLIAAEFLATQGFRVRVVDAGPDPRTCNNWARLGATHGGGDARMFTYTEADNYNEKGDDIYQNMRHIFRRTTRNGGWSVKSPSRFSAVEAAWVNTFERIPAWLAQAMRDDIYHVNQEAGKLWAEYMDRAPELFAGIELHKDILRLYAENAALNSAYELNQDLGSAMERLSHSELLRECNWLDAATKSDHLAGGMTVSGFTLSLHSFVRNLMDRITELGGELTWNCAAERIRRNGSGEVTALESQLGPLQADHFVISTGVTRNGLLAGTASENIVQGILGVWLQIPNLAPTLKKSTKIHRRGYLVEDINVTVQRDSATNQEILILGGGYGYVGLDVPSPDCPELQALFNELEEVARIYFPAGYQLAKERCSLWPNGDRKFCIRPFTPTGLGIFEDIPTASGGRLIITGGNNTGGFAQAPAIARAISRSLAGEHDPIHVLFSPHRSRLLAQAPPYYSGWAAAPMNGAAAVSMSESSKL